MFDPSRPYNELPLLPPKADIETHAILKSCIKAARALAEVKGAAQSLPDPNILLIMPPLEAKNSSAVENIITTTSDLYRAMAVDDEGNIDDHTKKVLRYRDALEYSERLLREHHSLLTTNLFEKICIKVLNEDKPIRTVPDVKLRKGGIGEAVYTPPEGESLIRDLLGNLETFINGETDLDPLIKMAVMHYQFEAIHPFRDGNGRTGRILNILYLIQQGLLDSPVLYFSRYFIENKEDYYKKLSQVTEQSDWESWIVFMLTALEQTSRQTSRKIIEIGKLYNDKWEKVRSAALKSHAKEILKIVFTRPYVTIDYVADKLEVSRLTATKYLKDWKRAGLLSSVKFGRNLLFINNDLMDLFVEFDDSPVPHNEGIDE